MCLSADKRKCMSWDVNLVYVMYTLSFKRMSVVEIAKEERVYSNPNVNCWVKNEESTNKTFKKCEWKTHTIKYSYKVK